MAFLFVFFLSMLPCVATHRWEGGWLLCRYRYPLPGETVAAESEGEEGGDKQEAVVSGQAAAAAAGEAVQGEGEGDPEFRGNA
jgi:hypothetical protein